MDVVSERNTIVIERPVKNELVCYHCGTPCVTNSIAIADKTFCCEGCKLVYEILDHNGLCDYYKMQDHPGLTQIKSLRNDKYAYLDNPDIAQRLYKFSDGNNTIVTFYIPGVHCSSCMWLLEHMHRLNEGITESRLNFTAKEVTIHFQRKKVSLRSVVELLTTIGYEPHISLDDAGRKKASDSSKKKVYKLGVAGFCFGNIMLMSFPEYLSHSSGIEHQYASLFRVLNLVLSIPVFFYSASEFFSSAWAGLRQRMLNIDAPIVLALVITYARSIYEISMGTGGGYLDSMSGIVFFMLVGRIVQERTYRSLSFHRDYKAYFPIAAEVVTDTGTVSRNVQDLKAGDMVLLHHDEIIPADAVLLKGKAHIDYSFVTGESEPVSISEGATLYAGGRQTGERITIRITQPIAGSYLTSLWNHFSFQKNKVAQGQRESIIHTLSKYFTYILLTLAALTALYWAINDPSKILPSVSAMLIVACPCALLLAATYTNGNLLRIFSNNGLFLRDAVVIEQLEKINHIVFDKTGTLTQSGSQFTCSGHMLSDEEKDILYNTVRSSKHPYSKALAAYLGARKQFEMTTWAEYTGKGIEATLGSMHIRIGKASFAAPETNTGDQATVYVRIGAHITAFHVIPKLRETARQVMPALHSEYALSLLSGDNNKQEKMLQQLFVPGNELLFEQKPIDKLQYIERLQQEGKKVMMIGDGLNDAGALQQSNVGVTLADDVNNFTPSCDAILDARRFASLPGLLKLAHAGRAIINLSFFISILYNIVGITISMQAKMQPMIAAILMPVSTLSIVLISTGMSSMMAKRLGLRLKDH